MYFNPTVVRNLIRKAGSSYGTNFLELGPRLLIGLAIIKVDTDFEVLYNSMGYFLVVSAFVIGLLPLKLHNGFSRKAADFLKPNYLKCLAPISICLGFWLFMESFNMSIKPWVQAARLRTLPLSISGILVGSGIALSQDLF